MRTCNWQINTVELCDKKTVTAVAGRALCMDHAHHMRAILALKEAKELVKEISDKVPLPNGLNRKAKSYVGKAVYLIEEVPI